MLIIISPAKTMDLSQPARQIPASEPEFAKDASFLASQMQKYTPAQLEKLLKVSPALAQENYDRYQNFDTSKSPAKQAILAYTGSVFQHIGPETLSDGDLLYAQKYLRIISTLYGLTRPLDRIQAYRIAFPLRLDGVRGNLYDYWQPKLTAPLIEETRASGGTLINLASMDVLKALDIPQIEKTVKIITPEFAEYKNGSYETIRTYAKMGRGKMVRYILQNRIEDPAGLKKFTWEDYQFNETLSDEKRYYFTRKYKK